MKHKFPYEWTLNGANFTKDKGKVFSCFACGGGSTMGYKLAGFDVIGCNEIDPRMAECYKANHNPKYCFIEPIQTFKDRDDLPQELYELDILDGSPPCSSFSMAGNREKDWGREKKFREGQKEQVLDKLFFDFIELGKKLQPKVIIAENVKGLLLGDAKSYVNDILISFDDAGYYVDYNLLDASKMGVPQQRERVIFYAIRKDIYKGSFSDLFGTRPELNLGFNEPLITADVVSDCIGKPITGCFDKEWERMKNGEPKKYFQSMLVEKNMVHPTILSGYSHKACTMPAWTKNWLSTKGQCIIGTYPIDYNFYNSKSNYLIGMSVPPVMMAQVATRVKEQWLKDIK